MESIQLYIDKEHILRLEFLDAVHPTLVHPKAEHWNFIYQIYSGAVLFDPGLYHNNFFICEQRKMLIIEEYDPSILEKDKIERDEDVLKNLRLFDLEKNKTGRFSKLTGHSFLLQKFVDSKFIFSKQYIDRTVEFEIDIRNIGFAEHGMI